jgi:hypothetical protein
LYNVDLRTECLLCLQVEVLQPHGNLLAKSGTDFKDLTRVDITLSQDDAAAAVDGSSGSSARRPHFKTQHIQITSDIPEDPEIAKVCWFCRFCSTLEDLVSPGSSGL